jgi:hypothetical protein
MAWQPNRLVDSDRKGNPSRAQILLNLRGALAIYMGRVEAEHAVTASRREKGRRRSVELRIREMDMLKRNKILRDFQERIFIGSDGIARV